MGRGQRGFVSRIFKRSAAPDPEPTASAVSPSEPSEAGFAAQPGPQPSPYQPNPIPVFHQLPEPPDDVSVHYQAFIRLSLTDGQQIYVDDPGWPEEDSFFRYSAPEWLQQIMQSEGAVSSDTVLIELRRTEEGWSPPKIIEKEDGEDNLGIGHESSGRAQARRLAKYKQLLPELNKKPLGRSVIREVLPDGKIRVALVEREVGFGSVAEKTLEEESFIDSSAAQAHQIGLSAKLETRIAPGASLEGVSQEDQALASKRARAENLLRQLRQGESQAA